VEKNGFSESNDRPLLRQDIQNKDCRVYSYVKKQCMVFLNRKIKMCKEMNY
jgi:hypothetical protein